MVRRVFVVLGAVVALGVCAPGVASAAGEGCPNEAAREAQGSTYLPDCRAYELLSDPSVGKQGVIGGAQVAADGSRVLFQYESAADYRDAVALREELPGGLGVWRQSSMVPPLAQQVNGGGYSFVGTTPDRNALIFKAQRGLLSGAEPPATYLKLDTSGHQTVLAEIEAGKLGGASGEATVTSNDGTHVFFNLLQSFSPEQSPGTTDVYDVGVQPPLLVSRLPDRSVPTCGVDGTAGFATGVAPVFATERQRWVSADGSVVFFVSRGSSGECGSVPLELYRRDIPAGKTTLISGPAVSGPESGAEFLQANAQGTAVVFETAASLTVQDTNSDPDIYRWTVGGGVECLTCVVADANVSTLGTSFGSGVGVSEDLSHVYFASTNQLAAGATEGVPNLYVWHEGTIEYIAPAGSIGALANKPVDRAVITPDGNVIVFTSKNPELDALTGSNNGGHLQYYRYDDRDKSLTCVSCPKGAAPTSDVPPMSAFDAGAVGYVQVLSDDGSRFIFRTVDSLVSQDVNASSDLYEWHNGTVGLITDGVSLGGTFSRPRAILRGISEQGGDVFFTSFARLTAGATDGGMQLYDARVGGGEPPVAGAAVVCEEEACLGSVPAGPAFNPPSSFGFEGTGNAAPPVRKPAKGLSRAQKLRRALAACKHKHGRSRRGCEARARRLFGQASMVRRGK
jgi:hypothetical protein